MDKEDDVTLSNLFKSRLQRASTLAEHSPASKRRLSRGCNALNKSEEANGKKSSPRQSSRKGDVVWAKPFSYTWWPGQVKGFKGPLVSISFFGCNKTLLFDSSEILRFEERYPEMVKMVGVKLSYEIGLALDELARNIAMGLKCSCRFSAADEDGSLAVKRGFNPQEIVGFVLDKAVLPQLVEGEIATVVRVSAALNAFRYGLVVCKTSEVDEGFCAEGVLDFVLDLAVNLCVDDKAVAQLNAFRRFASVKPDWFYQLDWELEEDSLEKYKVEVDLELPNYTSKDEVYHGRTSDPDVDILVKPQECELLDVNHKQEGRELCVINMEDFDMLDFDMDEKYESLIYNQHEVDADGGQSACRGICRNTNHERILHSCTEGASGMSEVDAEVQCHTKNSLVNDANETAASVICASVNSELVILSPHNYPNHMLQVDEEVTFNRSIVAKLESSTQEGSTRLPVYSDKSNSAEVLSSAKNLSQQEEPLSGGQLHSLPINKCSTFSPIKVLNLAIKPQSRPEVCFNNNNAAQCLDAIPVMAPFAETALQIVANKRKLYVPTSKKYKSPQTSASLSETITPSRSLGENNSAHVNRVNDEVICQANAGNDAIKFSFSNQHHVSEVSGHGYDVNDPGRVSKPYSRNSLKNHHLVSKWQSFYISPLMKDGLLHSTDNRVKFLGSNKPRSSSVLLNMKFPKDYSLPSKEELEKKFSVFGPLDHTRTKVFFYTGVGQVVFLHQADAVVAYNYVTKKKIFGEANVRFWFYNYDNCRKGSSNIPGAVHSSLNLKPCLKKSRFPQLIDKRKNRRVRFSCDNECSSMSRCF